MSAQRPFLRTYVALAVLAGLGAYIYFVESKREPGSDSKKKEKVFTLDKAKIETVSLTPKDGEAIKLLKDTSKGWRMTAPTDVAADGSEADAIVSSLESMEIDDVVADKPADLAEYGLDKPRMTVEARQGATAYTLLVGDKAPAGNGLYAKLPDKPRVFTIASYLEATFTKKPFDLRDRDVLHVKRDEIRGLEVTGPEGSYTLVKDNTGEWLFKKPVATQAGRWSVDGLLGAIEGLRMESVAAEPAKDLKPFGLLPPQRTVTLELTTGVRRTLEIGGSPSDKKYHARDAAGGPVVLIASGLVDDLAKGMDNLRAKRLAEVAAYDVEGFESEAEGVKRAYVKTASKDKDGAEKQSWKRTAPDAKDLETDKVQDVLFKVGGVDVQSFVDAPGPDSSYGLDKPVLKLTVKKPNGPITLELGQKDGVSYARRSGDAAILKIDSTKADELVKALKEL